ncbi:MAG: S16 family serine protease [Candidatus Micrarchaeota archaeon]
MDVRGLAALLLLISLSSAACEGSLSMYVPAVVGSEGGLVNVTLTLVPGEGDSFVSVYPRTGVATQDSIEDAVSYARSLSGNGSECDIIVDFGGEPTASFIDGPSGGTALTVMSYSLLSGASLRNDTIITGTIDQSGYVGPVGGLYEKAKGAASVGADYFITPQENIYEMILLRNVESIYGIKILQATKVEDVIAFMSENRSIEQEGLAVANRTIPDLPDYDEQGLESFRGIARKMVDMERRALGGITNGEEETAAVKSFYENELERQDAILSQGYLFSAANEAFLNYIDISTVKVIIRGDPDLPRKKGEAGICLSGVKRPQMTDANFEWVAGSDQRAAWAKDRIDSTDISGSMPADEQYARYNELMYADAWCLVSKELVAAAPAGGKALDEGAWKGLAEQKIGEASLLDVRDADTAGRLEIARDSFGKGRYAAAIYDAVYVIESVRADSAALEPGAIDALVQENRTSLWGKVYQSHAAFMLAMNQTDGALRSALLAQGLENATALMRASMAEAGPSPAPEETAAPGPPGGGDIMPLALAGAISIFLLVVVIILVSGRTHGNDGKRARKAYRARAEKK